MIAHRGEERLGVLAHLKRIDHVFKLLQSLVGADPGEHAAVYGSLWILRHLLGQLAEVGSRLQCGIDRIDAHLDSLLLLLAGVLRYTQEYVGRLNQFFAAQTGQNMVVIGAALHIYSPGRDEHGAYLLVAIEAELLLETAQSVQAGILGRHHLQLVVGIELRVFLHTLLIYYAFGVVLIVIVLKLTAEHGLPIHAHHHWVILRMKACTAHQ